MNEKPTYEQVSEFLKSKGFQGPQTSTMYGPGKYLFYKRVDGEGIPTCLCNDKTQLCVWVYDSQGGLAPSMEFDVTGEFAPDDWANLKLYSVPWDRGMERFDTYCADVLAIWTLLCARHSRE